MVGFASLDEVKSALAARLDFSAGEMLGQIEEDAREADRAYKRCRQIQTVYDYKDETQAEFKGELRRRLDVLAEKLHSYLAEVYGKDPHKQKEFEASSTVPLVHRVLRHHYKRRLRRDYRKSTLRGI